MPVYRYALNTRMLETIQRYTSGVTAVGSQSPYYKDITANAGATIKADLDEYMASIGYSFNSTDPVTTPTAQAAAEIGAASYDPKSELWYDHFITGNVSSATCGRMGWTVLTSGTGSNVLVLPGLAGKPGILRIEAGTSAAARAGVYLGDSVVGASMLLNASQNQIDQEWWVRPIASIAAVDLERTQLGLGDTWTLDQEATNGVYWRYAPATDLVGGWTLVTANGGVRSTSVSSTLPIVNTWVKLGIQITFPGGVPTAQGKINGSLVGSAITTNIPAAAVSPGCLLFSPGSIVTEAMMDLDLSIGTQAAA